MQCVSTEQKARGRLKRGSSLNKYDLFQVTGTKKPDKKCRGPITATGMGGLKR